MGIFREHDPLVELIQREHGRALAFIGRAAVGDAAVHELAEVRPVLHALAVAEAEVLYPAFSRVTLRDETQRLLDDCRDNRAQQEAALDALVRSRRTPARLRRLKALELSDLIQHHAEQHIELLLPVLRSQLPRVVYRAIVQAFATRVAQEREHTAARPQDTSSSRRTIAAD